MLCVVDNKKDFINDDPFISLLLRKSEEYDKKIPTIGVNQAKRFS